MSKKQKEISLSDAKYNEKLQKESTKNPDEFVVVTFETEMGAVKLFKRSEVSPKELSEVGKMLSEQFTAEVTNPATKLWVDFIEKYDCVPVNEVIVSGSNSMMGFVARTQLKHTITKAMNQD
jgi:hypothetical protein